MPSACILQLRLCRELDQIRLSRDREALIQERPVPRKGNNYILANPLTTSARHLTLAVVTCSPVCPARRLRHPQFQARHPLRQTRGLCPRWPIVVSFVSTSRRTRPFRVDSSVACGLPSHAHTNIEILNFQYPDTTRNNQRAEERRKPGSSTVAIVTSERRKFRQSTLCLLLSLIHI